MDESRPGASEAEAEARGSPSLSVRLFAPGTEIGRRYEVREVLGTGGSAVVYEAFDRELKRRVALKVLRTDRASEAMLKRFRREVAIARDAAGPRLVRVFDIGQAGDTVFLTMELVEGESLRDLLTRGPLEPARAAALAAEVLRALADLHALGIVHRDVKPGNVLLSEGGEVKLADFGLARHWEGTETRVTETEGLVGTVEYLSPEQALGDVLDARSDLYSVGVVLFEMLAGKVPLRGDSAIGTIVAHIRQEPGDVRKLRPETPAYLAAVVSRLLAKDRERRYATAADVLADLEARRASRGPRRWRRVVAGAGAAFGLLLALLALLPVFPWNRPRLSRFVPDGTGGVRALDGEGRVLWRRASSEPGRHVAIARLAGGRRVVVAIGGEGLAARKRLDLLDPETGRFLESMALPDPGTDFPAFSNTFDAGSLLVADLDGDGGDEVAVSLQHIPLFPSATYVCDLARRRVLLVFLASGHHYARAAADVDGDGRLEVLLAGYNNRMGFGGAVAALRLPRGDEHAGRPDGLCASESPDRPAHYPAQASFLAWYALLPATSLLGQTGLGVDAAGRVIRLERASGPPVVVAFDGFLNGPRDEGAARRRSAARDEAYAALREAARLGGAGFPEKALAEAALALDRARAAGDAALESWARRVHAGALLGAGRHAEADAEWVSGYERSEDAPIIALEAGRAFHLKGALARAVDWYRRGLVGQGARSRIGSDPRDLVGGEVLALGEMGRWDDAAAEIDRFEAAYPDLVADAKALRSWVAWRTRRRPDRIGNGQAHPGLYRYWSLELRRALGDPPEGLLAEAERVGAEARDVAPLLLSLRSELLFDLGRPAEGRALAAEAVPDATRAATSDVGVRAHLALVVERARRRGALATTPSGGGGPPSRRGR